MTIIHRTLNWFEVEDQRSGSQRIAPGIWSDRTGALHFSVPELLAVADLEDTPANRAVVLQFVHEVAAEHNPGALIIQQDEIKPS